MQPNIFVIARLLTPQIGPFYSSYFRIFSHLWFWGAWGQFSAAVNYYVTKFHGIVRGLLSLPSLSWVEFLGQRLCIYAGLDILQASSSRFSFQGQHLRGLCLGLPDLHVQQDKQATNKQHSLFSWIVTRAEPPPIRAFSYWVHWRGRQKALGRQRRQVFVAEVLSFVSFRDERVVTFNSAGSSGGVFGHIRDRYSLTDLWVTSVWLGRMDEVLRQPGSC